MHTDEITTGLTAGRKPFFQIGNLKLIAEGNVIEPGREAVQYSDLKKAFDSMTGTEIEQFNQGWLMVSVDVDTGKKIAVSAVDDVIDCE